MGSPKKNTNCLPFAALQEKRQKTAQWTKNIPKKRLFGNVRGLGYNIIEDWVRCFFKSVYDCFWKLFSGDPTSK
jgi:hypothetical protein